MKLVPAPADLRRMLALAKVAEPPTALVIPASDWISKVLVLLMMAPLPMSRLPPVMVRGFSLLKVQPLRVLTAGSCSAADPCENVVPPVPLIAPPIQSRAPLMKKWSPTPPVQGPP